MRALMRRLRPWAAGLCLAALATGVGQKADAHPFTVEDMLRLESFGAASFSPDQAHVAFERRGGYETADRFDLTYLGAWQTSSVWIAETAGGAVRPLLRRPAGRGHVLGPWSPSGRRLVVHRLRGNDWRTGVVEVATGSVRWLGLGAEPPIRGESVIWRSDDELILIVRADRRMPYDISGVAPGLEALEARWDAVRAGGVAASVWGGGALAGAESFSAPTEIIRVSLRTGAQTILAPGSALDMAMSPDRRWLAVVDRGQPYPVRPDRPFKPLEQAERRRLTIIDLQSAARWSPCGECDVGSGLLSWSASGDRLLAWIRDEAVSPRAGGLAAFDPETRSVVAHDIESLEPDVFASTDTDFMGVRADWQGDRPVILARTPGGVRRDWFRLEPAGPRALTAEFMTSPDRLEAIAGQRLLVIADGAAWSIDPDGDRTKLADGELTPPQGLERQSFPRQRVNDAPRRDWMFAATAGGGVQTITAQGQSGSLVAPQGPSGVQRPLPLAAARGLVVSRRVNGGVESLELRERDGDVRELMQINGDAIDIEFAAPVPVSHAGQTGEPLTSWLYRPPVTAPSLAGRDGALPVIVVGYPGGSGKPQSSPAEFNAMSNIQLLSARGYAVLVPTLPRLGHDDPAEGLSRQILSVVDSALDQNADLDPSRLGYLGHSFGGYAGLVLATQTHRFSSFVILSAPSDLAGFWGGFSGFGRANQEFGVTSRRNAGWGEQGQGAVGGPPWARAEAYFRASPVYAANKIAAPVLLVHGELDFIPLGQAESMFTALWRQNKDVELVTYWGEWHLIQSPGNIRDLFGRISRWFEETLPAAGSSAPGSDPDASPSDAPRPPRTPPPTPPSLRHANAGYPDREEFRRSDGR